MDLHFPIETEEHCPKEHQPPRYPSGHQSFGEFGEPNASAACSGAATDASTANCQHYLWIATAHSRPTQSQSHVIPFKLRFESTFVAIATAADALQQYSAADEPRTHPIH